MARATFRLALAVAVLLLLAGASFAAGYATASDRHVTAAQLASQRSFEQYIAKSAQAQTKQCFAKNIPDAKCSVIRIAPIGSALVSCGSGGCFEVDGTNAPVDEVTDGESCTTADGHAGVWESINHYGSEFACEVP